jgi:hypothetical protein
MSTLKTNNVQVGQSVTATNNFTLYQPSSPDGTVRLGVGNTGATTADVITATSAGNVGIGVTPSAWSGAQALQLGARSGLMYRTDLTSTELLNNAYHNSSSGYIYQASAAATLYRQSSGAHSWFYASSGTAGNVVGYTQGMALDASGNLLVGTTNATGDGGGLELQPNNANGGYIAIKKTSSLANGNRFMIFTNNGGVIGSITANGTSNVAYNTSSDYRLKDNVAPLTGALSKVQQLKPCTWKWKLDGSNGQGFIAHELQEVVPDCVVGEKDGVDENGKPSYQGIDTSFLVATLTAAIQELKAELDSVKSELATLKNG